VPGKPCAAARRAVGPVIPINPCAWAQVRIGAAVAHLQRDALDGAAEQVSPVLTLAPEFRIMTVIGWLADLDRHLARPRLATVPAAINLRQEIRDFRDMALPSRESEDG
jgi:hypothetical protein